MRMTLITLLPVIDLCGRFECVEHRDLNKDLNFIGVSSTVSLGSKCYVDERRLKTANNRQRTSEC